MHNRAVNAPITFEEIVMVMISTDHDLNQKKKLITITTIIILIIIILIIIIIIVDFLIDVKLSFFIII